MEKKSAYLGTCVHFLFAQARFKNRTSIVFLEVAAEINLLLASDQADNRISFELAQCRPHFTGPCGESPNTYKI